MNDSQIHMQIFSQIARLRQAVEELQHAEIDGGGIIVNVEKVVINIINGGSSMDFTRLKNALANNKSVGDVMDSIFDEIVAAIRSAKGNQAQLNELAAALESDNMREDLKVNALKDLVVAPPPTLLTASFSGATSGSVGVPYTGTVVATGGMGFYNLAFSVTLPDGFTIDNGIVSGTPSAAGDLSFAGSVSDNIGSMAGWTHTITVS